MANYNTITILDMQTIIDAIDFCKGDTYEQHIVAYGKSTPYVPATQDEIDMCIAIKGINIPAELCDHAYSHYPNENIIYFNGCVNASSVPQQSPENNEESMFDQIADKHVDPVDFDDATPVPYSGFNSNGTQTAGNSNSSSTSKPNSNSNSNSSGGTGGFGYGGSGGSGGSSTSTEGDTYITVINNPVDPNDIMQPTDVTTVPLPATGIMLACAAAMLAGLTFRSTNQ